MWVNARHFSNSILNERECELGNITRVCCSLLFYFWIKAKNKYKKRPRTCSHEFIVVWNFIDYTWLQSWWWWHAKKSIIKYSFVNSLQIFHHCGSVTYNKCWSFLGRVVKLCEIFLKETKDFTTHISHNKQKVSNHDCFSHVMRENFPPHDLRLVVVRPIEEKKSSLQVWSRSGKRSEIF